MKRLAFSLMAMSSLLAGAMWSARAQEPKAAPVANQGPPKGKISILEGYPSRVRDRIEQRRRSIDRVVPPSPGHTSRYFMIISQLWKPGQTIKIAFRGGDKDLHHDIAETVSEWTNYANLKFDFGQDPATGQYRAWKATDNQFAADIRVSFDQPGYYSLVGTDSISTQLTKPGEESLNLEGFDGSRPADWKAVALHEFGHAIGFQHEHQGPGAMCDFRFDDDPGYVATNDSFGQFVPDPSGKRPGLYTLLGGPPNRWPKPVVDFNLKQMPVSSAFVEGTFDKDSIMKYFFEDFMFVSGASSSCYTDSENLVPSRQDKLGAAKVYPKAPAAIAADIEHRKSAFRDFAKAKDLPATLKDHFHRSLRALDNH